MDINGELKNGRLENLASDPATTVDGRTYYNTTTKTPMVYKAWIGWVPLGSSGGGGGALNAVLNPSAETDLTGYGSTGTASATRVATGGPLAPIIDTAIKLSSGGVGDNVYFDFTMPAAFKNAVRALSWSQKPETADNAADWKVELWTYVNADYSDGSPTRKPLYTDAAGITPVRNIAGPVTDIAFTANDETYYRIRWKRVNGTEYLNIAGVSVEMGIPAKGAIVGEWTKYTPVLRGTTTDPTLGSGGSAFGYWRRVGQNLEYEFAFKNGGSGITAGSGLYYATLPPGLTTDFDSMITSTTPDNYGYISQGSGMIVDSGVAATSIAPASNGSTNGIFFRTSSVGNPIGDTYPAAGWWNGSGDGDVIQARGSVPILEWRNSGTVNYINDEMVYANARMQAYSLSETVNDSDPIPFAGVNFLEGGAFSGGVYTLPATGKYQVHGIIRVTDPSIVLGIKHNSVYAAVAFPGDAGVFSTIINGSKGDTISVNNATGSTVTTTSAATQSILNINRLPDYTAGSAAGFGLATDTKAGLLQPVATMSDELATSLGHKQYVAGTNYNGGISPTVTGASWTTTRAVLVPYKMKDGTWRLKGNISGGISGLAVNNFAAISLNGVIFKSTSNYYQSFSVYVDKNSLTNAIMGRVTPNTNTMLMVYNGAGVDLNSSLYSFTFDLELDSKPTWAY